MRVNSIGFSLRKCKKSYLLRLSSSTPKYENFKFSILKENGPAKERLGLLHTPHGDVR